VTMTNEERKSKAHGLVFAKLERARMLSAVVSLLKPLIDKAKVSQTLKREVLAQHSGVSLEDFDHDVRDIAKDFLADLARGKIVTEAKDVYTLAADKPTLSVHEVKDYAKVLLANWPDEARANILNVFATENAHSNADEED
jgi:hypothetical protein